MSDARTFSGKWVKGVFGKALAGQLDEALRQDLKQLGVDVGAPFLPDYSRETWLDAVGLAARRLFPSSDERESLRTFGYRLVIQLHHNGAIHSAALGMAKLFGPKRVLNELVSRAGDGTNYLRFEMKALSSRGATLHINDAAVADFLLGALRGVLELVGAKHPKLEAVVASPESVTLKMSWS